MTNDDDRPPDAEWREVQEQRYNKGFYPGSGKINPFFRKLSAPARTFGIQLLIASFLLAVLPPVLGLRNWPVYVLLLVIAAILFLGGIGHLKSSARVETATDRVGKRSRKKRGSKQPTAR